MPGAGASAGARGGLTPECPGSQGSGALPEMATEAIPSRGTQARPPKCPCHAHVETTGLARAVAGSQTQRPPSLSSQEGPGCAGSWRCHSGVRNMGWAPCVWKRCPPYAHRDALTRRADPALLEKRRGLRELSQRSPAHGLRAASRIMRSKTTGPGGTAGHYHGY